MFLQMIHGAIPRSWRAGLALLVVIVALQQMFASLRPVIEYNTASVWIIVKFIFFIVVSLVSAVIFYYFQAKDVAGNKYSGLETLGKAYESQQKVKELRSKTASPAFPDLEAKPKRSDDKRV